MDGGFSDWSTWSSCSQSCGDTAIKSRERSCTKPRPSGDGKNCSGKTFEIKLCDKKPCHSGKCWDVQAIDLKFYLFFHVYCYCHIDRLLYLVLL